LVGYHAERQSVAAEASQFLNAAPWYNTVKRFLIHKVKVRAAGKT
jgi:hypothetical protein